jgi:hypothetical protein
VVQDACCRFTDFTGILPIVAEPPPPPWVTSAALYRGELLAAMAATKVKLFICLQNLRGDGSLRRQPMLDRRNQGHEQAGSQWTNLPLLEIMVRST